jgi:2,3-bisphosphoglycerate-independent phosphoglycerate mutase
MEAVCSGKYDFIRLNFPNGDMVGHTGIFHSAMIAMETVDLCVGRLLKAVRDCGGIAVLTADHGNLEEMYETDKKGNVIVDKKTGAIAAKTSHTLSPVPFIIVDPGFKDEYEILHVPGAGLANVAATLLLLLGYVPPEDYLPPLIKMK